MVADSIPSYWDLKQEQRHFLGLDHSSKRASREAAWHRLGLGKYVISRPGLAWSGQGLEVTNGGCENSPEE